MLRYQDEKSQRKNMLHYQIFLIQSHQIQRPLSKKIWSEILNSAISRFFSSGGRRKIGFRPEFCVVRYYRCRIAEYWTILVYLERKGLGGVIEFIKKY